MLMFSVAGGKERSLDDRKALFSGGRCAAEGCGLSAAQREPVGYVGGGGGLENESWYQSSNGETTCKMSA
jgi:hypothetical protein